MTATARIFNGSLFRGGLFNGGLFSASPNRSFITTWDTTQAGVTGSTSIRLPLVSGEVYDFLVDWGDGSSETVAGSALSSKDHTYSVGGVYTVTISGTFPRIYFANDGDKLKLLTIENLGAVGWTSFYYAFYGCSNNTKCAGYVEWNSVTNLAYAWRSNNLTSWDINLPSSLTDCSHTWSFNNLTSWSVALPSSVTNCSFAWRYNHITSWSVALPASLNDCSGAWTSNNLTSWSIALPSLLINCNRAWHSNSLTSWNINLPPALTDVNNAWAFNSIASWTGGGWAGVTNAANALYGGSNAINTTDYNALLVAIEANNQNNNVPFHFGASKHSGAGTVARAALIADHGDTFTDGGAA